MMLATIVRDVTVRGFEADDVTLYVAGQQYSGWKSVRITRGIEHMPSVFSLTVSERYPTLNDFLQLRPGQTCEVKVGQDTVITGNVERVDAMISPEAHTITVVGRGKCGDLVDCMAEWPGGQVVASSVREVAQRLAKPFGVDVVGEAGPSVGQGNTEIPFYVIMIGERAWEVIERLARIAGLLAYEDPDGNLRLAANPADVKAAALARKGAGFTAAGSGFKEGVNVETATASFSMDQRFSLYRAYQFAFDKFRDVSSEGNLIVEFKDAGVPRYRPHAILMELGKSMGYDNAIKRAQWEAKRRWGRSHVVSITTDAWRDVDGALYAPNSIAALDLPSLKVTGVEWLISEVTYRLDDSGTHCDLTLMPTDAFNVAPTLPPYILPADVAALPNDLAR